MAKEWVWCLSACGVLFALAAVPAARAQAPDVGAGVCVENCGGGSSSGNRGNVSNAEARQYSSYVAAYNKARQLYLDANKIGNQKGDWSKALEIGPRLYRCMRLR